MALFGNKTSERDRANEPTSSSGNSFIAPPIKPKTSRPSRSEIPSMPAQINMIGKGAVIDGKVRVMGDVRIGGKVKGEVHVEGKAVVTPEGFVDGLIRAKEVDVAGKVKGNIETAGRLTLRSSARIDGNVKVAKLIVEEGALFEGECHMGKTQKGSTKITTTNKAKTNGASKATLVAK